MLRWPNRRIGVTVVSLLWLGSGYLLVAQESGLKEARSEIARLDRRRDSTIRLAKTRRGDPR
jgi:hypothetical protein